MCVCVCVCVVCMCGVCVCSLHLLNVAVGSLNDHLTEVVSYSHVFGCLWTTGVLDRPADRGKAEQTASINTAAMGSAGFNNSARKWELVLPLLLKECGSLKKQRIIYARLITVLVLISMQNQRSSSTVSHSTQCKMIAAPPHQFRQ